MSAEFLACAVAIESTYASISATTRKPDRTGLTFYDLPFEREGLNETWGATPMNENRRLRGHTHQYPPTANTQYDIATSARLDRREGEVTLSIFADTIGAAAVFASYVGFPIRGILGTAMGALADPASVTDTVKAAVAANTFEPNLALAGYDPGRLFSIDVDGQQRVAQITGTKAGTPDEVYYSPEVKTGGLSAGTVRFMHSLFALGPGQDPAVKGVCVRLQGVDVLTYADGCKLKNWKWVEVNNQLRWDFTLECVHIVDVHASAADPGDPVVASGIMAHRLAAPVVLAGPAPAAAPAKLASTNVEVESFEAEVVFNHDKSPLQSTHVPYEPKLTSTDITAKLKIKPVTTAFDGDFNGERRRQVMVPYGPHGAGAGIAFFLPGAFLTENPSKRVLAAGELVSMEVQAKAGLQAGVDASTDIARSPLVIGLGL